jgi:hypothetical protein
MAYIKTNWTDRQVQNPMTFTASGAVTGSVTLTPNEGTIINAGTPITSANLNNIENGIANVDSRLSTVEGAYLNKNGNGQINGNLGLNITPAFGLHQLGGSAKIQALATPTAPAVTNVGATGSSSYSYYVVAKDAQGFQTLVSPVGSTATGNATLSSTNYNKITWSTVAGAVSYDILKGDTGHSIALGVTGTTFNDTGQATSAYTAPTRNGTADLTIDGQINEGGQPLVNKYTRSGLRIENDPVLLFTNGGSSQASANVSFGSAFANASVMLAPCQVANAVSYTDAIMHPYFYNVTATGYSVRIASSGGANLGNVGSPANVTLSVMAVGS